MPLSTPASPLEIVAVADDPAPNVLQAERRAAALARGLGGGEEGWQVLVATARACLLESAFQGGSPERFYDVASAREAIAACRILDSAAQFAPQKSPAQARSSGLLAALGFAACGNFPSAQVVARRTFPSLKARTQTEAVALLCCTPTLAASIRLDSNWSQACKYLHALQTFLNSGSDSSREVLRAAWDEARSEIAEPLERALADSAVEHIETLCTARALRGGWIEESGALSRILEDGLALLLPPQRHALGVCRLHEQKSNAVVALPPGTGKTLLGEVCALQSLACAENAERGWACFLVPYVALGRQVAAALERHAPLGVRVHRLLGGEGSFVPEGSDAAVVVATPERLDALLRSSHGAASRLRAVICDEAHGVGDEARGVRLEGLLARLLLMQREQMGPRLVLLSASVRRPRALADWVGAPEDSVITSKWCATARRLAIWKLDGALEWHSGDDNPPRREILAPQVLAQAEASPEEAEALVPQKAEVVWPSMFGRSFLAPRVRGLRATDAWVAMQKGEEGVRGNIAGLVSHLHENFGGAILCVCATKKSARQLAVALSTELPDVPVGAHTRRAIELINKSFGFLKPLARALERGAAWHHAGLPHEVREVIEAAIKSGEISTVASTTTLAEGVDFPFRWTILVDWLGWSREGRAPLSRWLLRNIVGRCGRAGAWTEGDTILYENPLGDRRFTEMPQRARWIEHLCLEPGPSEARSALQVLAGPDSPPDWLQCALETQFLAALGENNWNNEEQAAEQFAQSLYVSRRKVDARPILRAALRDWASGEEPLVQAVDGALRLTNAGQAFRAADVSPATARKLLQVLRGEALRWQREAWGAGALLACELGGVPEQSHESWRKVALGQRNRFALRREDVGGALEAWLRGEAPEEIFARLPSTQKSTRQPRFEDWLDGGGMDEGAALSDWYGDLDKWAEWLRAVLETFLPFVLRACHALSPLLGEPSQPEARRQPWLQWAEMFEAGMDSPLALKWKASGAPGTRRALCVLAQVLAGEARPSRRALERALSAAQKELGGMGSPDGRSLEGFARWRGLAIETSEGEARLAA